LQQSISKGTLTVINMGYDAKISNVIHTNKIVSENTKTDWL